MQSKAGQSSTKQLKHIKATHSRPSRSNVHSVAQSLSNQIKHKAEHNITVQSISKQYKQLKHPKANNKHTKATHSRPSRSNVHSVAQSLSNQIKHKAEHNITVQSISKQYKQLKHLKTNNSRPTTHMSTSILRSFATDAAFELKGIPHSVMLRQLYITSSF